MNIADKRENRHSRPAYRTTLTARIAALLILLLAACQSQTETRDKKPTPEVREVPALLTDSINPNGTSELAVLMRRLADFAEANRQRLENNQAPEVWPDDIHKLLTARATDAEIKGPHYDAFAHDFITMAHRFNETIDNAAESRLRHNAVVGACVSCHEQACAGPLVRIKKLMIN